jgi:hypothetical protein
MAAIPRTDETAAPSHPSDGERQRHPDSDRDDVVDPASATHQDGAQRRPPAPPDPLLDRLKAKRRRGRWWEPSLDGYPRPAATLLRIAGALSPLAVIGVISLVVPALRPNVDTTPPPDPVLYPVAFGFVGLTLLRAAVHVWRLGRQRPSDTSTPSSCRSAADLTGRRSPRRAAADPSAVPAHLPPSSNDR